MHAPVVRKPPDSGWKFSTGAPETVVVVVAVARIVVVAVGSAEVVVVVVVPRAAAQNTRTIFGQFPFYYSLGKAF